MDLESLSNEELAAIAGVDLEQYTPEASQQSLQDLEAEEAALDAQIAAAQPDALSRGLASGVEALGGDVDRVANNLKLGSQITGGLGLGLGAAALAPVAAGAMGLGGLGTAVTATGLGVGADIAQSQAEKAFGFKEEGANDLTGWSLLNALPLVGQTAKTVGNVAKGALMPAPFLTRVSRVIDAVTPEATGAGALTEIIKKGALGREVKTAGGLAKEGGRLKSLEKLSSDGYFKNLNAEDMALKVGDDISKTGTQIADTIQEIAQPVTPTLYSKVAGALDSAGGDSDKAAKILLGDGEIKTALGIKNLGDAAAKRDVLDELVDAVKGFRVTLPVTALPRDFQGLRGSMSPFAWKSKLPEAPAARVVSRLLERDFAAAIKEGVLLEQGVEAASQFGKLNSQFSKLKDVEPFFFETAGTSRLASVVGAEPKTMVGKAFDIGGKMLTEPDKALSLAQLGETGGQAYEASQSQEPTVIAPDIAPSMDSTGKVGDLEDKVATFGKADEVYKDDLDARWKLKQAVATNTPIPSRSINDLGGYAEEDESPEDAFIKQVEDNFVTTAYYPGGKESGATVYGGIDLGQQSIPGLRENGLSESTLAKVASYVGVKGDKAKRKLSSNKLELTEAEGRELWESVVLPQRARIATRFKDDSPTGATFEDAPEPVRVVISSLTHHMYNPDKKAPGVWKNLVRGNYKAARREILALGKSDPRFTARRKLEASLLDPLIESQEPELVLAENLETLPDGSGRKVVRG